MFESMTYETILQRMLDCVPSGFDKREGSVIFDALAPAAAELAQLYVACDYVLAETFADTAGRENLIMRAAERGIYPNKATSAVVKMEYTPTNIDITGMRFSLNQLNYVVKEIDAEHAGICFLECETAGSAANSQTGTAIPIDYIAGLETAQIVDILIPGEDDEDTEAFRKRYFNSFEKDAFGGNVSDYQTRTNAIDGVGATKVIPVWDGGGTVKLIIEDATYSSPSETLVAAVQNEIDPVGHGGEGVGIAPIGHVVTVVGVESITVNVAVKVTFKSGYGWSTVGPLITAAIERYLAELRQNWSDEENLTVFISQLIARVISVPGVEDSSGAKINGTASNLELDYDEIPVLGEVTLWTEQ